MNYTKSIFDETGLSNIWHGQKYINPDFLKVTIKQRLQDQYIQTLFSDINNSSRVEYYSKFKTDFKLENYLFPMNAVHRNYICKLRTRNKEIPIEWVFLGMKYYAIFVIDALEINSIIFFVVSY
jgi:disulfide oxidoreductase YuzD